MAETAKAVASVAELRGERLDEPAYASAARALGDALRAALTQ
ncbi:hypothetical protein [Streptomyces sp. NPDC001876]